MDRSRHLIRSSLFVILLFGLNKVLGFVRLILVTQYFGAGAEMDAFLAANQLPELFNTMVAGGALSAAFIPVYSAYLTNKTEKESMALANTVMTLVFIIAACLCIPAAIFSPWLARVVLVPDFSPEQQILTAQLMQIILTSTILFSVSGVISSLLNAHQHFILPAAATVMLDMGFILALVVLVPSMGIMGLAWGAWIVIVLHIGIQIPALVRYGLRVRPKLSVRLAGVREIVWLMAPRIVTMGIFQAVDLVIIRLASILPEGHMSAYFFAQLFINMPASLFSWTIGTVVLPTMSEQYNQDEVGKMNQTASEALKAMWFFLAPSCIGLIALGTTGTAFVMQRGSFDESDTLLVYTLLVLLVPRILLENSSEMISRLFYARHNTIIPMTASLIWLGLNVLLSYLLVGPYGIFGLTAAGVIASVLSASIVYIIYRTLVGTLDERDLLTELGKIMLGCAAMATAVWGLQTLGLSTVLFVIIAVPTGAVAYLGIYTLVGGRAPANAWKIFTSAA